MALIAGVNEGKQLPASLPASLVQLIWPVPEGSGAGLVTGAATTGVWTITDAERHADLETFRQNAPSGVVEGATAVSLFSLSNIPTNELAQVYTLADVDGDNRLNSNEFLVAMKLIKARIAGTPIPSVLPPELSAVAHGSGSGVPVSSVAVTGVVPVLEQRIADLQAKLKTADQNISALQVELEQTRGDKEQLLLRVQDAESRVAQALAQVEAQNQQNSSKAMAQINELASQLQAYQQKMQDLQATNTQLQLQLQQQAQAARQQAEQYSNPYSNPFSQPLSGGNPFGGGASVNPFI
jgi:hypothetical protein